jgi:DNA-binding IclR family transcriptional regulator
MFGSKQSKEERLEQEVTLLEQESLSPAQIAERLNVPRSTVTRDLPVLEDRGVLLQEAEDGKLSIFRKA